MKKISIQTESKKSDIIIGESLKNLSGYLPRGKVIIITDDNLERLYRQYFPDIPVITTGLGEMNKTMDALAGIFDKLIAFEADRSTFIVAIGGGIVCDVAGFAASVYMRGLRYGFVSTTLLSQVDASVGGKNGVNFRGYKNMIGVFNQPEFVIIDPGMLDSLNEQEYRSGFAEIVKAAAIKDESLFSYLEANSAKALARDYTVLENVIYNAIKIKACVVEQDEKEQGERKKLNFGHTFAHAIEHLTGMLHGEAVSIGMAMASDLSVKLKLLAPDEHDRLIRLLKELNLPLTCKADYRAMLDAMKKDKKREGDNLNMVFLNRIGDALVRKTSLVELEKMLL